MRIVRHWFENNDKEDHKKKVYEKIQAALPAFEILGNILRKKMEQRPSPKEKDYESASWANLQAHRNGKLEAYEDLLKLITISDRE